MATLQIYFDEGPIVRIAVSLQILLSMLDFTPGMEGISFRQGLTFAVIQNGRRLIKAPTHIELVENVESIG